MFAVCYDSLNTKYWWCYILVFCLIQEILGILQHPQFLRPRITLLSNSFQKSKSNNIDQQPQEQPQSQLQQPHSQGATAAGVISSESSQRSSSNKATGALADILDLDFGAVQNNEVNQQLNRQYILDPQNQATVRKVVTYFLSSLTAVAL